MAVLNIVKFGDPLLRKVSRPVDEITPRIITLIDDMIETMRKAQGCGLAAVQVGVLRRIAVIEVEEGKVYELINPRIVAYAGEQQEQESLHILNLLSYKFSTIILVPFDIVCIARI